MSVRSLRVEQRQTQGRVHGKFLADRESVASSRGTGARFVSWEKGPQSTHDGVGMYARPTAGLLLQSLPADTFFEDEALPECFK